MTIKKGEKFGLCPRCSRYSLYVYNLRVLCRYSDCAGSRAGSVVQKLVQAMNQALPQSQQGDWFGLDPDDAGYVCMYRANGTPVLKLSVSAYEKFRQLRARDGEPKRV